MNLILTPLLFFTIIFTSFTSKNIELTHSTNRNNDTINQEYIHKKCYSLASRLTKFGIGIVSKNRREKIIATLSENSKNTESVMNIPKWISKKYTLKISLIDGKKVAIISPKKVVKKDKVVIYLHGGAYISNISFGHWWLIDSLCEKSGYTFIIPDYPLAPINKSVDVLKFMDKLYLNTLKDFPNTKVTIMGDSAGGGLTLAYAIYSKNNATIPQPNQLILLSPWIDLTHSNLEMKAIEKQDKMLKINLLDEAAAKYKGSLSLTDYRVSPLYGDLQNLPPTSIFIGTHDILFPDSKKLRDKLVTNKVKTYYFEYQKSFHVWMALTFSREAKHANKQIVKLLLD